MNTSKRRPLIGAMTIRDAEILGDAAVLRMREFGWLAPMAGAQTTYPDAIVNPLLAPTVSGTLVTVDFLLNNPTRVTRVIADLVMSNFFLDRIFAMGGDVQGGAVLYDQPTYLDVYTNRDVERIDPGGEFPILTGVRTAPLVAQVEKFGGKFPVTDEARRRNNITRLTNQMRRVANTMVRKMNQRGIAEINQAVAATGRTFSSISWSAALSISNLNVTPATRPMVTLATAVHEAEMNEAGYTYDTMILHPNEAQTLREVYGNSLDAALSQQGISNPIVTPRAVAGQAIICAGGGVGEMRLEEPMQTVTEYEGAPELRQQTWIQTSVNPVMYVTDPYAIIVATGIA
jgi:hypothetical protein